MQLSDIGLADLTGHSFSLAEECALSAAGVVLLSQTKHENFLVWGKVFGHSADYIAVICFSDENPLSSSANVFFSIDGGITFTILPPLPEENRATLLKLYQGLQGCYMGDPAFEYRSTDAVAGVEHRLLESGRLAALIVTHTLTCRAAPRGAYLRRKTGLTAKSDQVVVRRDTAFEGLDRAAAGKLTSYLHLRTEVRPKSTLETVDSTLERIDFLDSIAEDTPLGVWSLKYDPTRDCVYGQSLYLDGAVFYHVPGTPVHGNVYIGNGCVNVNLPFML